MLTVIEKENEIKKAQSQLEKKMNEYSEKRDTISFGGLGFNKRMPVSWSKKLSIWWVTYPLHNRYENAFGVQEPNWNTKYGHSITCVVSIPFKGINRQIGGAFAKDEDGRVYLLYRGKIGGGRIGISKPLFVENFRGEWETVRDGETTRELALIGALDSERFQKQLAVFIHEVGRIKNIPLQGAKLQPELPSSFKPEFSGTKKSYRIREIESKCDHGFVVNILESKLKSKGYTVGNRFPMDLYILRKNRKIEKLFEIKTDASPNSCYEAIGQLLFYSSEFDAKPILVAVFPNTLDKKSREVFGKIGIKILPYEWIDNEPYFSNLNLI